jgi:hypothetical protein
LRPISEFATIKRNKEDYLMPRENRVNGGDEYPLRPSALPFYLFLLWLRLLLLPCGLLQRSIRKRPKRRSILSASPDLAICPRP